MSGTGIQRRLRLRPRPWGRRYLTSVLASAGVWLILTSVLVIHSRPSFLVAGIGLVAVLSSIVLSWLDSPRPTQVSRVKADPGLAEAQAADDPGVNPGHVSSEFLYSRSDSQPAHRSHSGQVVAEQISRQSGLAGAAPGFGASSVSLAQQSEDSIDKDRR